MGYQVLYRGSFEKPESTPAFSLEPWQEQMMWGYKYFMGALKKVNYRVLEISSSTWPQYIHHVPDAGHIQIGDNVYTRNIYRYMFDNLDFDTAVATCILLAKRRGEIKINGDARLWEIESRKRLVKASKILLIEDEENTKILQSRF